MNMALNCGEAAQCDRPCGRVKLLPFWLRGEWVMCSLVQGTPLPQDLGTLTRTHPLKVGRSAALALVTLGAMSKHPTRSTLRDEGWFGSWFRQEVLHGRDASGASVAASLSMEGQEAGKAGLSLLPLSLCIYSGTPNPWDGASHTKGESPFLRALWKLPAS